MGFVNPQTAVDNGDHVFRAANGWTWTYTGLRNHEVELYTGDDGHSLSIFFTPEGRANIPDRCNDGRYELVSAAPTEGTLPPDPVAEAQAGRTVMAMADGSTRYATEVKTNRPGKSNPVHDMVWLEPSAPDRTTDYGLYFWRDGRDNIGCGHRVASARAPDAERPADTVREPDTGVRVCPHDEIAAGRTWFRAADGGVWYFDGDTRQTDRALEVQLVRHRAADGRTYPHAIWFVRDGVSNIGDLDGRYRLVSAHAHHPDAERPADARTPETFATVPKPADGIDIRLTQSEAETLRAICHTATVGPFDKSRRADTDSVDAKLRHAVSDERASEVGREIEGRIRWERSEAEPASKPVHGNLQPDDRVAVAAPRFHGHPGLETRRRNVRVVESRCTLVDGRVHVGAVRIEGQSTPGEPEDTEFVRRTDGRYTRGQAVLVQDPE